MRHLRGPSVPGFLLALLMGLGLLLPEVGHSLAHHHEAEHHGAPDVASHEHDPAAAGLTSRHSGGDHPHGEPVAAPAAKPLLTYAVVVHAVLFALHDFSEGRPLPPTVTTGLSPGGQHHGPPSPSRAPPQL